MFFHFYGINIIVSCSYLNYCSQSFFQSFSHSFFHAYLHSFIPFIMCHSFGHLSFNAFIYACMQAFIQSSIHSFQCSFNFDCLFLVPVFDCVFTHYCFSFISSFMSPSIHLSTHSFNLSFMHSCIHHAFRHLGVSPFSSFLVLFHFGLFIQSLVSFYWCPFIVCGFGSGLNARLRPDQVTNSTVNWIKLTNSMMNDIIDWFVESLEPCWCFKAATQPSSSLCQLNHLTLSTSQDSLVSWCAHNLIWLWLGWVWCSLPCGIHVHKMTLRLIETHSILQLNQAGIMMLMLIFCYELDKIHLSLMQTCAYKQSQTK